MEFFVTCLLAGRYGYAAHFVWHNSVMSFTTVDNLLTIRASQPYNLTSLNFELCHLKFNHPPTTVDLIRSKKSFNILAVAPHIILSS